MIKANTCPYCGAAYTLSAGGCVQRCAISEHLKMIIRIAALADDYCGDELEQALKDWQEAPKDGD